MTRRSGPPIRPTLIDDLIIGDEASLRHVSLYEDLKAVVRRDRYPFRVLQGRAARADRARLLNLIFWSADAGGDVLVGRRIEADVVAHAAWHHLAAQALRSPRGHRPSAAALFLGEAIASAFDVYLVGRLLGHAPCSTFLTTQIPAMADAADAAGMTRAGFAKLLATMSARPERAFAALRALLFDASMALFACKSTDEGWLALGALESHRFSALLPRYALSNWVLYARAYADPREGGAAARRIDRTLRQSDDELSWLQSAWIEPALAARAAR